MPVKYGHRKITVVATVDEVRFVFEDRLIARHPRHWGREEFIFDPVHYLALLERKPGGLDHARPPADWDLPDCFDTLLVVDKSVNRMGWDQGVHPGAAVTRTGNGQRAFRRGRIHGSTSTSPMPKASSDPGTPAGVSRFPLFSLDGRPHLKTVHVDSTDDGEISQAEQFYLLKMIYSDGQIRECEKQFLQELRSEARIVPAGFEELCETAMSAKSEGWDVGGRRR